MRKLKIRCPICKTVDLELAFNFNNVFQFLEILINEIVSGKTRICTSIHCLNFLIFFFWRWYFLKFFIFLNRLQRSGLNRWWSNISNYRMPQIDFLFLSILIFQNSWCPSRYYLIWSGFWLLWQHMTNLQFIFT